MRVLVTGAGGMLGRAAVAGFTERGHEVAGVTRAEADVTSESVVKALLDREPEVVIQCAAYTDVDGAERNPEIAREINAHGASRVARECQRIGALFVYPSTDYVFSGATRTPWKPADPPRPLNAYGRSKLEGEREALRAGRALVVRTSWLYGEGGRNFVETIGRIARERDRLEVVDDQVGRPTWTRSLVGTIAALVEIGAHGIFHASDGGEPVSWYGFARAIVELHEIDIEIVPVSSEHHPRPARRPAYSVLDCSETERLLGVRMMDWRESLRRHLNRVHCA